MSSSPSAPDPQDGPAVAPASHIVFEGHRCVASGTLREVVLQAKAVLDRGERAPVIIFDARTSEVVEIDFRGTPAQVLQRLSKREDPQATVPKKSGPGRPKLGVTGREVTLLPRHWEWLDTQPGGASVALRKLVETARRTNQAADRARRSQDAAHRFMYAMAGNLAGFEEACRAFYAGHQSRFERLTERWPAGVRDHVKQLAAAAFRDQTAAQTGK